MTYLKDSYECLPHSDVVVDGFSAEDGEVDVDAVSRGHPDTPHTVLEVGVFSWVTRGEDGAIHGGDVSTTQSFWGEKKSHVKNIQYILCIDRISE